MSVEWFDLGQRLLASRTSRPAPRLDGCPHVAGNPVAVEASRSKGTLTVAVASREAGAGTARTPRDVFELLRENGVSMQGPTPRTLVTGDHRTLPTLLALARDSDPSGPWSDVAATIAHWAARADFPGTSAYVHLPTLARTMLVTGAAPAAEREPDTWRTWLNVSTTGLVALLDLYEVLTAPDTLAGLTDLRADDADAWQRARTDHAEGTDWRTPDHVGRAAVGLAARCAAAETYEAALLDDPRWRRRAVHTGHVVTGNLTKTSATRITVDANRLDCRLRAGTAVVGWAGGPTDRQDRGFVGTVVQTEAHGTRLALNCTVSPARVPATGSDVTLMPAPPKTTIATARGLYIRLYGNRRSWLTTGRTPRPSRRDVPLDVLVAAAEKETD